MTICIKSNWQEPLMVCMFFGMHFPWQGISSL